MAIITFAISASTVFIALQVSRPSRMWIWLLIVSLLKIVLVQRLNIISSLLKSSSLLQICSLGGFYFIFVNCCLGFNVISALLFSLLSVLSCTSWLGWWGSSHTTSCLSSANSCPGSAWPTLCCAPENTASSRSEVRSQNYTHSLMSECVNKCDWLIPLCLRCCSAHVVWEAVCLAAVCGEVFHLPGCSAQLPHHWSSHY